MSDYALPFPGRDLADKELTYDPCYAKIPPEARSAIVDKAWEKGAAAARALFAQTGGETNFSKIARSNGLDCVRIDKDYIVGNQRYFSDYISGRHKINLYLKSIALWAQENQLDTETATNVILSHEYFHFLEWTTLGLTSREYQVPMLRLGAITLGKTGIRALSEIGAHAFARTYYELEKEREHNA